MQVYTEHWASRGRKTGVHGNLGRATICSETMQVTIHGIGTAIYGERDYWPYGSFVTTEWAVLAWIPIFPTFSKRISYAQTSPYATYDASGYYVHETTAPNLKQVLFVYGWFACLIGLFVAFGMSQDELARIVGDEDRAAALWFVALGIVIALPYGLRRVAKGRKMKEWKRASLGLGPPAL